MSHEKKTGGPLLSIESWLFSRGPYVMVMVYEIIPNITGEYFIPEK